MPGEQDRITSKPDPMLVQLGIVAVCALVLYAIYKFSWVPFSEDLDRRDRERENAAAAVPPAAAQPVETQEGQVRLKAFAAWASAKIKDGTLTIDAKGSSCEKNGLCEKWEGDENEYTVYFFRQKPDAVRLKGYIPMEVTCEMLGGTSFTTWPPRTTGLIRAGGAVCKPCALVGGLGAVIENNRRPDGTFNAGVHLVTVAYMETDGEFTRGVTNDVNGTYR